MSALNELRDRLAALDAEPLAGQSGVEVTRRRAEAVDQAVRGLAPASDRWALIALGGYGRSELAPGSDIDLMILHEPEAHAEAEEAFAPVLYALWDLGLQLGHAVRTPEECLAEAERRLDTMTALLDGRHLGGPEALLDRTRRLVLDAVRADPGWLLDELRASMVVRETRFGALGETSEPNLRDSVGGLRDVQMLGWLARGFEADLPGRGWLRPGEAAAAEDARDLFLLARTALHRAAGGRADQMLAEHHDTVAAALGFADLPSAPPVVWEARDLFMRRLFLAGRAVRFAAAECLDRATPDIRGRAREVTGIDQAMSFGDAVLGAFARVAEADVAVGSTDLDRIESEARATASDPWTESMRSSFIRVLSAGEGGARAIGALDVLGVMAALMPEWDHVRGRPQRDPFHRFPADTHLVRTAAHLATLMYRPEEPLAAESVAAVRDPGPLLVSALLHDIGKVGSGGHAAIGGVAAETIASRMGFDEERRKLIRFLVAEHLLLSETATRRNLEDEDLILHVAARVESPERLAGLYLLTLADAESTGPSAATPWRLGLVRELVARVGRVFQRGDMTPDRAQALDEAERELRAALAGRPADGVEGFLARIPPAYLSWVDPADGPSHFDLVVPRPALLEARSHHRPGLAPGVHSLTVGSVDRPGLLASIAGALTLAGLSVLSAQAFTTEDGVALDAFDVTGAFEPEVSEERWRRFRTTLRHALEGRIDVADRIQSMRAHYRAARTDVEVTVRVDQDASDFFTVVEVGAADRLGLLFDLARTFADRGLDVHLAKVATYGPRVVDVFYLTGSGGQKVNEAEAPALESALRAAVGSK